MRICAFDLGCKNTAIAIEEFDKSHIKGSTNDELKDSVYTEGKILYLDKVNFTPDVKGTKITNKVLLNVTDYIEENLSRFKECDLILIERQYKTRGVQNSSCIHLEHHIQAILLYLLRNTKTRVEIYSAKFKTKTFDDSKMTKPQRKKFTINEASNLLLAREDYQNLEIMNKNKKDDYADVIMMIQSYKFKLINKYKKPKINKDVPVERLLD